jgi:hypothetical protein
MRLSNKLIYLLFVLLSGCSDKNDNLKSEVEASKINVSAARIFKTKDKKISIQLSGLVSEVSPGEYLTSFDLPSGIIPSEVVNSIFLVELPLPGMKQVTARRSQSLGKSISATFFAPPRLLEKIRVKTSAELKIKSGFSLFEIPFEAVISPSGQYCNRWPGLLT